MNNIICKIEDVSVNYPKNHSCFKKEYISALSHINLEICENDIYGLVGESGCGKSTLCNAILGFTLINDGKITLYDKVITNNKKKNNLKEYRKDINVISQNPFQALNPRFLVWRIIVEPLIIKGEKDDKKLKEKALEYIKLVGLHEDDLDRYVFEFSGGQRQRIAIARALASKSKFIILDEPTSALDVSVQSQISNLLLDLKEKYNLTYLFVSHNLALIYQLCNKIAVIYNGQIVEKGYVEDIFNNPMHPYTKGLISSVLDTKKEHNDDILIGESYSSNIEEQNCRFSKRCPYYNTDCDIKLELREISDNHYCACVNSFNLNNNKE